MLSIHDPAPPFEAKNDDKASISELDLAPLKLTHKLRNNLLILINDYRNKHSTIESEQIRKHLYHIENRSTYCNPSKRNSQKKYLELCGLLFTIYDSYNSLEGNAISAEESELKAMIHKILTDHKLKRVYQLSNNLRLNGNCLELYKTLNPVEEPSDYVNALYQLQQTIKQPNIPDNIYFAVNSLIIEIEINKNASRKHITYYTNTLVATNQFINPASNPRLSFNEYLTLANHAPGRPSSWKKIAGSILFIACTVGLTLCIASCLFLTSGLAAPFIFLGITSAIAQLGVLGLIGGSFAGSKLKKAGEASGISKAMLHCHKITATHSQHYPDFFKASPLRNRTSPQRERANNDSDNVRREEARPLTPNHAEDALSPASRL